MLDSWASQKLKLLITAVSPLTRLLIAIGVHTPPPLQDLATALSLSRPQFEAQHGFKQPRPEDRNVVLTCRWGTCISTQGVMVSPIHGKKSTKYWLQPSWVHPGVKSVSHFIYFWLKYSTGLNLMSMSTSTSMSKMVFNNHPILSSINHQLKNY